MIELIELRNIRNYQKTNKFINNQKNIMKNIIIVAFILLSIFASILELKSVALLFYVISLLIFIFTDIAHYSILIKSNNKHKHYDKYYK